MNMDASSQTSFVQVRARLSQIVAGCDQSVHRDESVRLFQETVGSAVSGPPFKGPGKGAPQAGP